MWYRKILTYRQLGGLKECPYFRRTILNFGMFTIRFHRWYGDDDNRALHCHPFSFVTFVITGGYTDVNNIEDDILTAGSIRFRKADYIHSVRDVLPNTRTILITTKPFRRWGFYVEGKLVKRDKYFAKYGHHPCDPSGEAIRIEPDGERIK